MLDYDTPTYATVQGVPGSSQSVPMTSASGHPTAVIDGTPIRVAAIVLVSAVCLIGLRKAGFKFSSTVSVS